MLLCSAQNKTLSNRFKREKKDCYFNPGVMVVNADAWRKTGATKVKRVTADHPLGDDRYRVVSSMMTLQLMVCFMLTDEAAALPVLSRTCAVMYAQ